MRARPAPTRSSARAIPSARRRCCARPATAAHAEALVTADLLRRIGMNVELQASDWGTVLTRRARKSPVGEGGWSIFHTSFDGPAAVDPSINLGLRADGEKAWFGWPTDEKLERLKRDWIYAEDKASRDRLAAAIQARA